MTFARARSAVRPPALTCPLDRARYVTELLASSRVEFGPLRMEFPDDGGDAGGGAGDGGTGDGGGSGGGDGGTGGGATSFTQEQMNENARKSKAEGERAARRKVYADLGLDPETTKPEDLQTVRDRLKAAKDADDAKLSEAEKAQQAAKDAEAAAKADREAAAAERHTARIERALGVAGLDLDDEKATSRALKLLDVEVGADADAVKAAVKDLKKDMPTLFGGTAGGGNGAGDGGGGGRGAGGGAGGKGGGVQAHRERMRKEKAEKAGAGK